MELDRFARADRIPIGPYVIDFACLRARLAIEVDGGVHDRMDVAVRDLERDAWLATQGYRVLRIDRRRIPEDLDGVVAEIIKAIRHATPLPLEGEGVGGWGGGSQDQDVAREAPPVQARRSPSAPTTKQPASTPPNPPPRGEGFR